MDITLHLEDKAVREEPELEQFANSLQLMINRMVVSHYKYGNMRDKYPMSASGVGLCRQRADKYESNGNVDYLLDAANGALIEFLYPGHPKAHHEARETRCASPGLVWKE